MRRRVQHKIFPFDSMGLLAYLKFNNNITDSSSFARATVQGVPNNTYDNGLYSGVANESLVFTSRIDIPDADDLSFGDGTTDSDFTIGVIIKPTTVGTVRTIAVKGDWFTGFSMEYFLFLNTDNKMYFYLTDYSTGGQKRFITTDTFASGTTYNVDAVYEGGVLKIYIDGVSVAGTPSTAGTYVAMENGVYVAQIGVNVGVLAWAFSGNFDEFTIWNRALSATDVSDKHTLYLAGTQLL